MGMIDVLPRQQSTPSKGPASIASNRHQIANPHATPAARARKKDEFQERRSAGPRKKAAVEELFPK
jgi:hypothetical protein